MPSPDPGRATEEERQRLSVAAGGMDKVKISAADYMTIPVTACAALEPVLPTADNNIFTASYVFCMLPVLLNVPISMTVYRCPASGDVTIFNALRVSPEVEDAILALGSVKHVVKLGQFHGAADAYYLRCPKFSSPVYWGLEGMTTAAGLDFSHTLAPDSLPIAGAELVVVDGMPYPEGVLLAPVPGRERALIVCDALSHMPDVSIVPILSRPLFWWFSFVCEEGASVPPTLWLKTVVKLMGKEAVVSWFDKLFAMEWETLLVSHGSPVVRCERGRLGEALATKIRRTVG